MDLQKGSNEIQLIEKTPHQLQFDDNFSQHFSDDFHNSSKQSYHKPIQQNRISNLLHRNDRSTKHQLKAKRVSQFMIFFYFIIIVNSLYFGIVDHINATLIAYGCDSIVEFIYQIFILHRIKSLLQKQSDFLNSTAEYYMKLNIKKQQEELYGDRRNKKIIIQIIGVLLLSISIVFIIELVYIIFYSYEKAAILYKFSIAVTTFLVLYIVQQINQNLVIELDNWEILQNNLDNIKENIKISYILIAGSFIELFFNLQIYQYYWLVESIFSFMVAFFILKKAISALRIGFHKIDQKYEGERIIK